MWKRITALLLILSMIISSSAIVLGASVKGKLVDRVSGMMNVKFNTGTGDYVFNPKLSTFEKDDGTFQIAFTYSDPRLLGETVVIKRTTQTVSDVEQVKAILAFRELFNPQNVYQQFGVNPTQQQIDDAIQLALWQDSAKVNKSYVIDTNSITDVTVRSLAQTITTWATQQVFNSSSDNVLDNLLVSSQGKLNTTLVKKDIQEERVIYGPYTIDNAEQLVYTLNSAGVIVQDTSGNNITEVKTGQQFYINLTGASSLTTNVRFTSVRNEFTLMDMNKRLWLQRTAVEDIIEFNLQTDQSATGTVVVSVTDSFSGNPLQGVPITISQNNVTVESKTTAFNGQAEFNVPIGDYKINSVTKVNYIATPETFISVPFIGSVSRVDLPLRSDNGRLNIQAVDSASLATVNSIAYTIYKSTGDLYMNGSSANTQDLSIDLPAGDYYITINRTAGSYAVTEPVYFTITQGDSFDVVIPLKEVSNETIISVSDVAVDTEFTYVLYYQQNQIASLDGYTTLSLYLENNKTYSVKAINKLTGLETETLSFNVEDYDYNITLSAKPGDASTTIQFLDVNLEEPIIGIQIGVYDSKANLVDVQQTDETGTVFLNNLMKYNNYYITVVSADVSISGEFVEGNRFIGNNRELVLHIKPASQVETNYITPVIGYTHNGFVYPEKQVPVIEDVEQVTKDKRWWEFWK